MMVVALFGPDKSFEDFPNFFNNFLCATDFDVFCVSILYFLTTFTFLSSSLYLYSTTVLISPTTLCDNGGKSPLTVSSSST
uniref:Uncharacterized protein n=1 Tax=Ciona intestinalis TaxID=7719 RepID=H2XT85_CIOIN